MTDSTKSGSAASIDDDGPWVVSESYPPGQFIIHDRGTLVPGTRQQPTIAHFYTRFAAQRVADDHNKLLAIVRRVAEHFEGTDAPLGIDARAAIVLAKSQA